MNSNIIIKCSKVSKYYGSFLALDELDFSVNKGEIVTIIGPSGSGKSTLLKVIISLENFSSGEIKIDNIILPCSDKKVMELRKFVGMVFQQFNLFNHLSVIENVSLAPIKSKKIAKSEAIDISKKLLQRVGLLEQLNKYPNQLSGGQQQRVAIARALAMEPKILLFDEPTSALDPEMVKEVLDVIRELSELNITMLIVTHEMGFAKEASSRMCFCHKGKILVNEKPQDFFNYKNQKLSEFISKILY